MKIIDHQSWNRLLSNVFLFNISMLDFKEYIYTRSYISNCTLISYIGTNLLQSRQTLIYLHLFINTKTKHITDELSWRKDKNLG